MGVRSFSPTLPTLPTLPTRKALLRHLNAFKFMYVLLLHT